MSDDPWYVTAFQADYRAVYPHRDLASAAREVEFLIERGVGGRVLDLCCGFGRHTLALRRAGLDAYGADLSGDLLVQARDLPESELLAGRLARADARRVPFGQGCFDSVVVLFSSFGYFHDGGDAEVLEEVRRVLRPGGLLVLDLMNPTRIRAGLVPESRTERDGVVLHERRALEDGGRRVTKEVVLERGGREQRRWKEDVRMYEPDELRSLLDSLSFRKLETVGDFEGAEFGPGAERQLLFARSPE